MRILIIEDEPRAANQLQSLMKLSGLDYEILAILDSVEESVKWLTQNAPPDLLFMDIQLADGLSFEIFQKIEVEAPIIFTTAFDQYAIQAFKVNSIDYLLKPIQKEALDTALDKYLKSSKSAMVDSSVLKQLLASVQSLPKRSGILVKSGSALIQIKISDLLYIYSEDSLTFGVTAGGRFIIDETMNELFKTLDNVEFYRINRGQIVSKSSLRKIEPYFNHRLKLTIENSKKQEFIVSRQKTSEFKDWMNS